MAARAVGGAAATLGRAFGDLIAAPGAADLEGLIEHRDEVERIIALAPIGGEIAAEIAARHRAADGAVIGIDADRRGGAADLAVRGAEEEMGGAIRRGSEERKSTRM